MANSKGVSGNNVITGGSGNDKINGGANNDILDGGAGSDSLNGDSGNDILIYKLAENGAATDVYTGGSGIDTVRIDLTQAEWMNATVQYQLARYYQHLLTVKTNPKTGEVSNGSASDFTFDFGNGSKLTVQMMERLEITVDGVTITNQDQPVIKSAPQAAGVVEDGDSDASPSTAQSANGSINFFDIDLSDSHIVSVTTPPAAYGVLTANVSNPTLGDSQGAVAWSYQLNNAAVQFLAAGEQRTEVFTVRIADADNSANFAETQVTVTITGTNDAPIITAEDLIGGITELVSPAGNLTDSGSISFSDVDFTDEHLVSATGTPVGTTFGSLSAVKNTDTTSGTGGQLTWTYSVAASAVEYLAAGQTKIESFTISIDDQNGGVISKQIDVTITGTNDAPIITAEDLAGSVTEQVTPTGNLTDSGSISFSDVDITDEHLVSAVGTPVGATLGSLSAVKDSDTTGSGTGGQLTWTYSVAAGAVEYLSAGQTKIESFTISLDDQNGGVITKQIDVTITGTNDAPIITAEDLAGSITEQVTPTGNLTDSGSISFSDVDLTDEHLVSATGTPVGATLGSLSAVKDSDTTGSGTGGQLTWTYSVAASAVEYLAAGQTKIESFTISIDDQNGGVISKQIDVTITGSNDAPVIQSGSDGAGAVTAVTPSVFTVQQYLGFTSQSLAALESYAANNAASYTVTTGVIDYTDDPAGFAGLIPGSSPWPAALATGTTGTGAVINNNFFARITGQLRVDATDTFTFRTYNDDGVFVKVNNQLVINDPGIHPEQQYLGNITLSPGVYPIELFFFEFGGEASLEFSYRSSGGSFGLDLDVLRDNGIILFNDVDLSDAHTVSAAPVGTNLGSLTAIKTVDTTGNGTGGQVKWDYSVNNDDVRYLGAGDTKVETFTITVNDGKGGTDTQQVDVTITGINDPAILGNAVANLTETNAQLSTGGILSISDVDQGEAFFTPQANTAGTFGNFSISAGGAWNFSSAGALDYLVAGQVATEIFNVESVDGTATTVTVTVTGTNDAAVLGSAVANLTETDAPLSTSGTLSIIDLDAGQAFFNAQSGIAGTYGSFNIDANGAWSYNTNDALDYLLAGQNVADVFNVTSVDGTATTVTVNIAGTADGPTGVNDSNSLSASTVIPNNSNTVYWVDWQTVTITGARVGNASTGDAPVLVNGTITLGNNHVINVTYEGLAFIVQANDQKYVYTAGGLNENEWVTQSGQPAYAAYTSSQVGNLPGTKDIIGLNEAFTSGGSQNSSGTRIDFSPRNLTFSEPVENLFFAVSSMNSNGYKFDQNFQIVSQGPGKYGDAQDINPTNFGNGQYGIVSGGEFNGVLKIDGSVEQLTWTSQNKETWNGFTVGTYGQAQTSTATGNLLGNDIADASNTSLEVSAVGGQAMVGNSFTLTLLSGATIKVNRDGDYLYDDKGLFASLGGGDSYTENVVYTVRDNGGNTDTATLTITINGVNDVAVLGSAVVNLTETDAQLSTGGTLSISDVDTGEAFFTTQSNTAGTYGSFSITANGAWSYNTNGALDYLLAGQNVSDVFNVTSVDGTATTVTVNIAGTASHIVAPGNLAQNGSFENNLTGWAVLGGGVDRVQNTGWQAADGSWSLDLNAFLPGGVQQAVATQSGTEYGVFFQISKNYDGSGTIPTATMKVSAAGTPTAPQNYVFAEANSPSNMLWRGETFVFTANNSSTNLSFESLTSSPNPAKGPALDNVVILANTIVNGFDKADGDVLSLANLLSSIGAPNNVTAFDNGYLRFQQSGSDTLVQVDANGGADDYLTAVTLVGVTLSQSDTGNYVL